MAWVTSAANPALNKRLVNERKKVSGREWRRCRCTADQCKPHVPSPPTLKGSAYIPPTLRRWPTFRRPCDVGLHSADPERSAFILLNRPKTDDRQRRRRRRENRNGRPAPIQGAAPLLPEKQGLAIEPSECLQAEPLFAAADARRIRKLFKVLRPQLTD